MASFKMRYHYQVDKTRIIAKEGISVYRCDHPMYNYCTLFKIGSKGLAVVQKRYNTKLKVAWWDCVDIALANDIFVKEGFKEFLESKAKEPDQNGLYPTISIRKIMWALRMKPLVKAYWENDL